MLKPGSGSGASTTRRPEALQACARRSGTTAMPFAANTNCGAAVKCGTRATTVRVK